jgi:hypothetical protein
MADNAVAVEGSESDHIQKIADKKCWLHLFAVLRANKSSPDFTLAGD